MPKELPEEALDAQMWVGDCDNSTLANYLKETLCKLIEQGEMFSGKRPLGDSGWFDQIYQALVDEGHIPNDTPMAEAKDLVIDLICNWM